MSRMYLNIQTDSWGKISWPKVESFVFRFQTRIYKASKDLNYGKMRALQTRLALCVHARLLAVRRVTMDNNSSSLRRRALFKPYHYWIKRMELVRTLKFDGKVYIRRTWIPPIINEVVADRAKQALAKMVLEPEWEARFEPNSYGFRPGRSCQDAILALASLAPSKYVLLADIALFDRISSRASLLEKLDEIEPPIPIVMRNQIKAWLNADIMTGFANSEPIIDSDSGEPLAPLLANIALHGMENALNEWAQLSWAEGRSSSLVRYADDFVVLHKARRVVQGAQGFLSQWLQPMGRRLVPESTRIVTTGEGFHFLAHDVRSLKGKVRVAPSKKSQETLLFRTREVIQSHKGSAVHRLISALVPLILGWGNYFNSSECSAIFHRMDWRIFQQLRAWVFRRHPTWGRQRIKHKYFPENQTWRFHGKKYRDNWVLYDSYKGPSEVQYSLKATGLHSFKLDCTMVRELRMWVSLDSVEI